MDHRISKDMISSGMSYTGQKTQADLGRTQYGSAARPDSLSEAYASMYSIKEQEEAMGQHPGKSPNKAVRDKYETETRRKQAPTNVGVPDKSKGYVPLKDDVDLFDLIKGHLMDEGLTEAAAIEMMVSMTEEERNAVIEELTPDQEQRRRDLSKAINKVGTPGYPGPNDAATRKMQGEFIKLQKLKGV